MAARQRLPKSVCAQANRSMSKQSSVMIMEYGDVVGQKLVQMCVNVEGTYPFFHAGHLFLQKIYSAPPSGEIYHRTSDAITQA